MGQDNNKNILYITHSGEFLIWLIIIFIIVALSTVALFVKEKSINDYNIFMPDVDGLIVGSPVRMMGIQVGHVTKIQPTNEEVFVKFILTDDSVKIPQGTVATVEFSGMAGSKSLELYLPDKNTYIEKNTPILTVDPPKRLHDALGLLNDMFDKLTAIIYTSSSFGEKLKLIDIQTSGNGGNVEEFLNYADKMVDDSNKRAQDLGKKLEKYEKKGTVNGKT